MEAEVDVATPAAADAVVGPGASPAGSDTSAPAEGGHAGRRLWDDLRREVGKAVVGIDEPLRLVLVALLADGHVLVEDVPGTGKTLLARAVARALDLRTSRVQGTPLIVIAGKEYGSGSSRDWAAKGPALLGVRAVLAESFERIHRSNLVGMGVLPLQLQPGESASSLGITGHEAFTIHGLADVTPKARVVVTVQADGGAPERRFSAIARLDGPIDVEYYRHGGILPAVLRRLAGSAGAAGAARA